MPTVKSVPHSAPCLTSASLCCSCSVLALTAPHVAWDRPQVFVLPMTWCVCVCSSAMGGHVDRQHQKCVKRLLELLSDEEWLQCTEVTRAVAMSPHIFFRKMGSCCCANWPASTYAFSHQHTCHHLSVSRRPFTYLQNIKSIPLASSLTWSECQGAVENYECQKVSATSGSSYTTQHRAEAVVPCVYKQQVWI